MILLIDNYDSFSYNLYQFVGTLQPDIKVVRNNELSISQIEELSPTHIILSPGPGTPENAGICIEAAKTLGKRYRCLASVWDIRLSAAPMGRLSAMQRS